MSNASGILMNDLLCRARPGMDVVKLISAAKNSGYKDEFSLNRQF